MAYWVAVAIGAAICTGLCVGARRQPGRWVDVAGWLLAAVLLADAAVFLIDPLVDGSWTVQRSLPFPLCDVALILAAVALIRPRWWPVVELTYFWGLAGTLQAVATPDLTAPFPHLQFLEYVVGHVGIVVTALFLVVGRRLRPRDGAVPRVWFLTAAFMLLSGLVDALTGANYNFLERLPGRDSLLSVLGPWPWYLVAAAALAVVVLVVLDLPFRRPGSRAVGGWLSAAVGFIPTAVPGAARAGPSPGRPSGTRRRSARRRHV